MINKLCINRAAQLEGCTRDKSALCDDKVRADLLLE